jgi:hypothetical protein
MNVKIPPKQSLDGAAWGVGLYGLGRGNRPPMLRQTSAAANKNRSRIRHMKAFHSGREAKEFLISRIVQEAQRENVPLSETERKMLYFTESGWTLPDIMKVNEDFDRDYKQMSMNERSLKLLQRPTDRFARVRVTITRDGGPQSIFFNEKIITSR